MKKLNWKELKKEIVEWTEAIFIDNIDNVFYGVAMLIVVVVILSINF